jgi:hypothetical protein
MTRPNIRPERRTIYVLFLAATLVACGAGESKVFSETPSPSGGWILRLTVAESRMPQGPFYVAAYVIKSGTEETFELFEVKLENDGVPFTTTNIAARWTSGDTALICLRATDLPDRGMRVKLGATPHAVEVNQC